MKLTFLEAKVPLTKSYHKVKADLVKAPYPHVTDVTSHEVIAADMKAFEAAMRRHAALGHCLLKGTISRPLVDESRAGTTDANATTDWICLDVDGLPGAVTVDALLTALGFDDISYVLQWSASYGIENPHMRAHILVQLDKQYAAPMLKQWLIALNLETSVLDSALRLTKTGNAISWPLDISTCQNDKLIYIAPPTLKGIKDPMNGAPRISYIKKLNAKLTIEVSKISMEKNKTRMLKRLGELREAAGLPKRKVVYRVVGATEVQVKPDACFITEMKEERGFVYFNLNGGDSWGYFHPANNPDFIYNFKGEPVYLTKELLPDYWAQLHAASAQAAKANANTLDAVGVMKLAFLDPKTDKYWRGTYTASTDRLALESTASLTALRHYAVANGVVFQDDAVPEWTLLFDPQDNVRVDVQNTTVNLFQPTIYMQAVAKAVPTCPKTIYKVIHHALGGGDDEAFDRFINWLAYVLQVRDVAGTAWVFHGVPGTGKGTLLNRILKPLFGHEHIAVPRMQELEKEFNGFIDRSIIVAVDEVDTSALVSEKGVMADLRRYITEQHIPLRRMHRDARLVRNYSCWLFFSNASAPVRVTHDDRRFNVGRYQATKLAITDAELERIEKELQAFHDFLLYYPVDKDQVITPMQSQDRDDLIDLTESAVDGVVNALQAGDMGFFMDQMPTDSRYVGNMQRVMEVNDYKQIVNEWLLRTDRNTGVCNVARDELSAVFQYTAGVKAVSPNKFTSLLKHHRLRMTKVRVAGKPVNGAQIIWKDTAEWTEYLLTLAPPTVAAKKAPLKLARVK
jgi:hypothetical protein